LWNQTGSKHFKPSWRTTLVIPDPKIHPSAVQRQKKQASCQAQKNTPAGVRLPVRIICTNIASFS